MKIIETKLKGCFIIEPVFFNDNRGLFFESYKKKVLESVLDYTIDFVQDNISISKKGVLRGLHFQMGKASQAKLVRVTKGEVLDVVVDTRKGSETFGKHFKMKLSSDNHKAIFIPKGMAHGFLTLSEEAIFNYKCDNYYYPNTESGIIYNDENLDIDWESQDDDLIISKKDLKLPKFSDL